ncbi:hypothetical protein [Longimicrobium sp.]|uniref:hypothetical protein n=1 Tax=Longimicrobium sp. TaxID=2029185 RepID=UPI002BE76964|nr:hypothetical protein [Longimicrobium sp.]HSU17535.1 hypothetical protein [Longimicrobium sp.]
MLLTVHVRWVVVSLFAFLAALALWILEDIRLPQRAVAFFMLLIAFFSVYSLAHVFLIRRANSFLYSTFLGCVLGWLVHLAFFRSIPAADQVEPGTVGA